MINFVQHVHTAQPKARPVDKSHGDPANVQRSPSSHPLGNENHQMIRRSPTGGRPASRR